MSRTNLQRLIIIGILAAVAALALAFPSINLDAVGFHRGGPGPLGLRLGLDLQGGVHLVYQAVRPPNVLRITFPEGVDASSERIKASLQPILAQQGRSLENVTRRGPRFFTAQTSCRGGLAQGDKAVGLQGPEVAALEQALREQIGALAEPLRFTGCEDPTGQQMEGVSRTIDRRVNAFGVTEPIIQRLGSDRLLVQLPGVGDPEVRVTFERAVATEALREALAPFGRKDARITQTEPTSFRIQAPSLKPPRQDAAGNVVEPPERERIKEALSKLAPVTRFDVAGGVEEAKRLIGQTALLIFKHRNCKDLACNTFEDIDINLTGDNLARAFPDRHSTTGAAIVSIEFDSEGARIFGELTSRISAPHDGGILDRIAIFLDEQELLAPVARQAILGGRAFIEGPDFTPERVRTIAIQLESGRLPVPVRVLEERDVDATLGSDALRKSLEAGAIGLGAVIVFMALYYRVPGLVASGALAVYIGLVLAIFKLFPVTLTLAGVAGFILSLGMAVDANVIIFERMKEELRRGRTLLIAMDLGFNRAWPAIRDSNVTTFITCAILWWFGSRLGASLVVGFAVTLFIGVALSMFSAIFVSRAFLLLAAATPLRRLSPLFTPVPSAPAEGTARPITERT